MMHFEIITLKMYELIDMHSNYDNMHKNGMFYASIYIKNHMYKLHVIRYIFLIFYHTKAWLED